MLTSETRRLRYINDAVTADLTETMVFVGGPRQVGKTTFALSLLADGGNESSPACLNWDVLADRDEILAARLPPGQPLIIFDEIPQVRVMARPGQGLYDKDRGLRQRGLRHAGPPVRRFLRRAGAAVVSGFPRYWRVSVRVPLSMTGG